jgi:hypothetical protein
MSRRFFPSGSGNRYSSPWLPPLQLTLACMFLLMPMNAPQARAESALSVRESMNMFSILESAAETLNILNKDFGLDDSSLSFTGSYSNTGGTMQITGVASGSPITLDFLTTLSLSDVVSGNVLVNISSRGSWLSMPISTAGLSEYIYDATYDGYREMNYDDLVSTGLRKPSKAVRAAEIIVGAPEGLAGILTAWSISDVIDEIFGIAIPAPTRPSFPAGEPSTSLLYQVHIDSQNSVLAIRNFGQISGFGLFSGGTMNGLIVVVPEIDPAKGSSALSLVAGVLAMIEQRRRRGAASTSLAA